MRRWFFLRLSLPSAMAESCKSNAIPIHAPPWKLNSFDPAATIQCPFHHSTCAPSLFVSSNRPSTHPFPHSFIHNPQLPTPSTPSTSSTTTLPQYPLRPNTALRPTMVAQTATFNLLSPGIQYAFVMRLLFGWGVEALIDGGVEGATESLADALVTGPVLI